MGGGAAEGVGVGDDGRGGGFEVVDGEAEVLEEVRGRVEFLKTAGCVQGYLIYKKAHPPRTLP